MGKSPAGPRFETMGELLDQLGDIHPDRVRLRPAPGKAGERDLIRLLARTDRLYELVDGTLVEKVMGFPESALACELITLLGLFLRQHDLGFLAGESGAVRLWEGLVRMPDVLFVSWEKVPRHGQIPAEPIAGLAPDLAVEILSPGNTAGEMQRKLKEYFLAGVRLVWLIDPAAREVRVHTAPDQSETLTEGQTLTGGEVLPGLAIPLAQLFARLPPPPRKATRKKRKS
jgi:Uma2 family endonuclease